MDTAAAMAILMGYFMVVLVIGLVALVLMIIGYWKIFTKAGDAGWKSLIPFYSEYTMFKVSWNPVMYWPVLICSIVYAIIANFTSGSIIMLGWVAYIAMMVIQIIQKHKLSKAFGHGGGFTVGLVLLPFIFFPILGLGSSEYTGPQY